MEIIGYIGAFLLATCALPQTIMSVTSGSSYGLSFGFLWSWYLGEILMALYVVEQTGYAGPVFWNFMLNIVLLTPIIYYKHFPRG